MRETFGLDRKIDKYKGTRPISFYRRDMECILDVLDMTLKDADEYPDKEDKGYTLTLQKFQPPDAAFGDRWIFPACSAIDFGEGERVKLMGKSLPIPDFTKG